MTTATVSAVFQQIIDVQQRVEQGAADERDMLIRDLWDSNVRIQSTHRQLKEEYMMSQATNIMMRRELDALKLSAAQSNFHADIQQSREARLQ